MKRITIIIILGILLIGGVTAGVGLGIARSNNIVDIAKPQQDILDARGLTDITIRDLECDGTYCRSCAETTDGYRMGCIKIADVGTNADKETAEANAYKLVWEDIADVIVDRENRVIETIFNEGDVEIGEAR